MSYQPATTSEQHRPMSDLPRCAFEKPILSAQCHCPLATRTALGEALRVRCQSESASNRCFVLRNLLRDKARFALKVTDTRGKMPFGKELRVMIGGLAGLAAVLEVPDGSRDIDALIRLAQERFGSLEALPFERVVRQIAATPPRRRRES